jgi:glutamine amidotransferase
MHALRRLGTEPEFTADPKLIDRASHVILPGVGAAGRAMSVLREYGLVDTIRSLRQPVLGVCLGMQLLFESSAEDDTKLLGLIPSRLERIPEQPGLRVPHMGWNAITKLVEDPLTRGLDGKWFSFVHSYAAPLGDWTLSSSTHCNAFSAIVRKANFCGAQFHPERSAGAGAQLLRNFLESSAA